MIAPSQISDPYYMPATAETLDQLKKQTRHFYQRKLVVENRLPTELAARVLVNAQSEPAKFGPRPARAVGRPSDSFVRLLWNARRTA